MATLTMTVQGFSEMEQKALQVSPWMSWPDRVVTTVTPVAKRDMILRNREASIGVRMDSPLALNVKVDDRFCLCVAPALPCGSFEEKQPIV